MKVHITGPNGYLARKLQERNDWEWTTGDEYDIMLLCGSPTHASEETIPLDEGKVYHKYVIDTIQMMEKIPQEVPIVFISTSDPDMIDIEHEGSTTYNLAKMFLESYIVHYRKHYQIHRMGTLISHRLDDIKMMKPDRIQQRILARDYSEVMDEDWFVYTDVAVDILINAMGMINNDIVHYPDERLTKLDLLKLTTVVR